MKLYFMKKEALDTLKDNLDLVYNKYYTDSDNKWLWNVCGGNPFIEYKDVPEFRLSNLNVGKSIGEIELENCKLLYMNLKFLNESQASDERLWAGLCHSVFYEYVRKRWDYHKLQPNTQKDAVSNIKSRFFFSGGIRSGLYRNTLSKCWWVGRNTYDMSNKNHFEKLDIIGSNDISTKISDIFYSNNFSSNPIILDGIVEGIKYFNDEGIQLTVKEHIRPSLQLLNAIGGGVVLDCLSKEDISNIFIENIYSIIQGDEQEVESDDADYTDAEEIGIEEDGLNELYVALGHKVYVRVEETGAEKVIRVDYIQGTTKFPDLAKILLGKKVGDAVFYKNSTYIINKIG